MKRYDKSFKEQAVRLVLEQGRSAPSVARDIGIHDNTMYKWISEYKKHKENAFPGSGNLRSEDEELRSLRKRVADLEMENEILKKSNGHLRERPEVKYSIIHKYRFRFPVEKMCQILDVSRSGYYAWASRPESRRKRLNRDLLERIKKIHIVSRENYGSPRVTKALNNDGIKCGKNRVAKLMKENNIAAKTKRKFKATTNSKHSYPVAPNILNQDFKATKPNQIWVADITYIPTDEGWLYLAAIVDLFQRKVVGWAMDSTMTKQLCIDALKQAIGRCRPSRGLIHHSDRGVQYASNEYKNVLKNNGITQSMSRKGNCYDNACMESFFGTLKTELIYFTRFKTRAEARLAIFEYIEVFYNRIRLYSKLGYRSPDDFEKLSNTA